MVFHINRISCVSFTLTIFVYFADDVSPSMILKFLLQNSQVNLEGVHTDHIELVDSVGNRLGLSINTKSTKNYSHLTLTIKSSCLSLVAKCKMAVVRRLQVSS